MAYNGWKNYETWAVKLWMDNDEGEYRHWQAATDECREECRGKYPNQYATKEQNERMTLADTLKEYHEEQLPEVGGFAGDLLGAAFGEVDWTEIAESLLADARENDEPDEDEDSEVIAEVVA